MDWIKDILATAIEDEAKLTEVIEGFKKEFPKHAVPKSEFNGAREELKLTKEKLGETSKLIGEMQEKAGLADEYKTKLTEWETKYQDLENEAKTRLDQVVKRSAVKDVLSGKMAKSAVDLVLDRLDYEAIQLTEKQTIDKADELVNKLKADYEDLFIDETRESGQKNNNTHTAPSDGKDEKIRRIMGLN